MVLETPCYLIDERRLLRNLKIIRDVRERSGAKSVLALKCFSAWSVFGLMKKYMDGTTSSSVYEARLGYEKFGKEVHAYCVAYSLQEIKEVSRFADKVIFNSFSQLERFAPVVRRAEIGLRLNPGVSYSRFDLADPARRFSRLGVAGARGLSRVSGRLSGVMFHFNCENADFRDFSANLDRIAARYGGLLRRLKWVSLGGGLYFTREGYPLDRFCRKLREFADRFGVQVYLEPGETAITQSAELVTRVLDIVENGRKVAIVDASTEAHLLDLLIYRTAAKIKGAGRGRFSYVIAGRSCLAGDVFGEARFVSPLKVGSIVRFADAAGYSMVKKNWFNGLAMPAIAVRRLDGSVRAARRFTYKDFVSSQS